MNKCNLANSIFGRLKVIKECDSQWISSTGKTRSVQWECLCDCGNITYVRSSKLVDLSTTSCGCYRKERSKLPRRERGVTGLIQLYLGYKHGAHRRGLTFSLTEEIFRKVTRMDCHYCGISPAQEFKPQRNDVLKEYGKYTYNGIDRVDNERGYEIDNIVPCCKACNIAKSTMSYNAFLTLIRNIYNNHYTKGKYTEDGKFDKNKVSDQIGIAPIMKVLLDKIGVVV